MTRSVVRAAMREAVITFPRVMTLSKSLQFSFHRFNTDSCPVAGSYFNPKSLIKWRPADISGRGLWAELQTGHPQAWSRWTAAALIL